MQQFTREKYNPMAKYKTLVVVAAFRRGCKLGLISVAQFVDDPKELIEPDQFINALAVVKNLVEA